VVTAREIMTKEVVSTQPYCRVAEVIRVLYHHGISGLPVLGEEKQVIGMVTEADILGLKSGQELVQDIMSAPVYAVCEDTPLEEIATLLSEKKIKRAPVVREGRLVGIVSRADVVRALAMVKRGEHGGRGDVG
jgi:CBS domain-containing protein